MTRHELLGAHYQYVLRFAWWLGLERPYMSSREELVDRVLLRLASRS